MVGFRIDPADMLDLTTKELLNIHRLFATSPIFGVDFTLESEAPSIQQLLQPRIEEDTEIIEDREDCKS